MIQVVRQVTCLVLILVSIFPFGLSHRSSSNFFGPNYELPVDESSLLHSLSAPRIDTRPVSNHVSSSNSQSNHMPFHLTRGLHNVTKSSGSDVSFKCEFRGDVPVTIQWFRNEAPVEVMKGKIEILPSRVNGSRTISRLKVSNLDVHDMGFYKCQGSHGDFTLETIGILRVEGGMYISSQAIPDFTPDIDPEFPGLPYAAK